MNFDNLIKKAELAKRLGLGMRAVDGLVKSKKIPVIRLNRKTVLFNWPDVERALESYVVRAV